jgi:hypothetical protein
LDSHTLRSLLDRTFSLFADSDAFAPALDWVEEVLPVFVRACRRAVNDGDPEVVAQWLDWVSGAGFLVIEEAGRGEVFAWRRRSLLLLLGLTRELIERPESSSDNGRVLLARNLAQANSDLPACFSDAFWINLTDYLCDCHSVSSFMPLPGAGLSFPLLLSDRVVIDGRETEVLLATFLFERTNREGGEIFLHPEEVPMRAIDCAFGATLARAGAALRDLCSADGASLPNLCVRIRALRPEQERFLQGLTLRGDSAAGAITLGALCALRGQTVAGETSVSFALAEPRQETSDGACHPVGGLEEKVRGCVRHGIARLLVAFPHPNAPECAGESALALYARRHGIEIVRSRTIAEAAALLAQWTAGAHPETKPPAVNRQGARVAKCAESSPSPVWSDEDRGVVPLDSPYYIVREQDDSFAKAMNHRPMIVLVKGARQMGKSSLLIRGVDQIGRHGGQVVWTDIQKLNASDLASPKAFYLAMAGRFSRQLLLDATLAEDWNDNDSPNMNFEYFLLDHVLANAAKPIYWLLDEADRLFSTGFYSEIFGLMRSWHNDRSVQSAWANLTLVLAYATETQMFIQDPYQSPFNVGRRLDLEDFTLEQTVELNGRYLRPLKDATSLHRFRQLVAGHPYLSQQGLSWMASHEAGIDQFEAKADRDDGPLGDHLRRLLGTLRRSKHMPAVREVLEGRACPSGAEYYYLRSAGILAGDSAADARMRCGVYARYLERNPR